MPRGRYKYDWLSPLFALLYPFILTSNFRATRRAVKKRCTYSFSEKKDTTRDKMKVNTFSSLGIALAMFLTGKCSALPETNRDGNVQLPDLSTSNPYGEDSSKLLLKSSLISHQAVTRILDSAGSTLNARSNEPLDLEARDKSKSVKLDLSFCVT